MDEELIRDDLDAVAGEIAVGDENAALGGVKAAVRRRRRRRRALGALGVTVVLVGGMATVVTLDDSDGDDSIRSASPTTTIDPTVGELDEGSATPDEPATPERADSSTVESVVAEPRRLPVPPPGETFRSVDWLVPWEDGFLRGGSIVQPQPLPEELPDEIVALFPAEVVELFADGLPGTVEEATAMLSAAGLLDEVTAIVTENADAYDAIYAQPSSVPEPIVEFTLDGEEWIPVEVTLPDGVDRFDRVTVAGDRLVVAQNTQRPDLTTVVVATTTDLATWETQVVPITRPADLPAVAEYLVEAAAIAANETGWALGVSVWIQVRSERYLPAELVDRFHSGAGMSSSIDDDGIEVELRPEGGEPESYSYTWDELGVDEALLPYITGPAHRFEIWAAPFSGTPARGDTGDLFGPDVLATPTGFVQLADELRFSPDGLAWATYDLPLDNEFAVHAVVVDDDLVVFTAGGDDGDGNVYRVGPPYTDWTPLEIPGAPEPVGSIRTAASGSPAFVVDVAGNERADVPVVVELDGYRFTQRSPGPLMFYELADLESGEIVLSEWTDLTTMTSDMGTGPFEFLRFGELGGVTLLDPESGEVIVEVSAAVLADAYDDAHAAIDEPGFRSDLWVMAAVGADRWFVDDLDDEPVQPTSSYYGPSVAAVNGEALLVMDPAGWFHYDLGS